MSNLLSHAGSCESLVLCRCRISRFSVGYSVRYSVACVCSRACCFVTTDATSRARRQRRLTSQTYFFVFFLFSFFFNHSLNFVLNQMKVDRRMLEYSVNGRTAVAWSAVSCVRALRRTYHVAHVCNNSVKRDAVASTYGCGL